MFKVPDSAAGAKKNRFEFEVAGVKYDVPKLGFLPGSVTVAMAEAEKVSRFQEIATEYLIFGPTGTPMGDAVRSLDQEQWDALKAAYYEDSGITPGESEGSSDS